MRALLEIDDIKRFLAETIPFHTLDDMGLSALAKSISVKYARRGSEILTLGAHNSFLYIVRSGAVELKELGKNLSARLAEGSCFAYPSLLRGGEIKSAVTAIEDTLLYMVPAHQFHRLREQHESINHFFSGAESERLRNALRSAEAATPDWGNQTLRQLVKRAPIHCDGTLSLQEAANIMAGEAVSTMLVFESDRLTGIMTDKDIQSRAVAKGLPYNTPITEIMTPNPLTMRDDLLVLDALLLMSEKNIHHLPVNNAAGDIIGLVSANDILSSQALNAIPIVKNIRKASRVEDIAAALKQLPAMVVSLVDSGMKGARVAANISSIGMATHRKVIELAEKELGPPPVPYCYLAFGSLARRDQTLNSDQDNGILLSNDFNQDAHGAYFEALAKKVSDGLNSCGYVYCGGNIMASNLKWRQTLDGWIDHFRGWITAPDPKALMHASIFFDSAVISGDAKLADALSTHVLKMAGGNKLFLAHMVENALSSKVPIGFFRRFVLTHDENHSDTLDIKKNGIVALVDIARVYALAAGIKAVGLEERLEALKGKGLSADADLQEMKDAWQFMMAIRLAHQAKQIQNGQNPDNMLAPSALSPFEREHLRDAFSLIKTHQEGLSRKLAGGFY